MKRLIFFFLVTVGISTYSQDFKTEVNQLADDVIWGMDFLNDEEMIYTLRSGSIYTYNLKTKKKTLIKHSMDIKATGQGGLLDILVDGQNILLTYSKPLDKGNITTALYKGKLENNQLVGSDLFVANTLSTRNYHFGSRIIVYKDSYLFSVGERGIRSEAQNLKSHHGKILRLLKDGKPHPENPFPDAPYIFSYGHRNPQGMAIITDSIYEAEFGPKGGDEINLIVKGKNYGWPIITYGTEYYGPKIGDTHREGMEQPLHFWVPSISPSGLMIYQGNRFPKWRGNLFLANLSSRHLRRLVLKEGKVVLEEELLKNLEERNRVVKQSRDGLIYVGTDSGKLIILSPL